MPYAPPKRKFSLKEGFAFYPLFIVAICFAGFSIFRVVRDDPYSLTLTLMLVFVGLVGFAFRQRYRLWYGIVEWGLGIMITMYPFLLPILKIKSGLSVDIEGTLLDLKWASEISGI